MIQLRNDLPIFKNYECKDCQNIVRSNCQIAPSALIQYFCFFPNCLIKAMIGVMCHLSFYTWLESLQSARGRFRKLNSKYIESIESARGIYPPRNTNFPHWLIIPLQPCAPNNVLLMANVMSFHHTATLLVIYRYFGKYSRYINIFHKYRYLGMLQKSCH